jgi:hypothetical protein
VHIRYEPTVPNWAHVKELPVQHAEKYDILPVSCVEATVFGAKDLDNPGHHWMVIDSDYCPWPEEYDDDTYGIVRVVYHRVAYLLVVVVVVVAVAVVEVVVVVLVISCC